MKQPKSPRSFVNKNFLGKRVVLAHFFNTGFKCVLARLCDINLLTWSLLTLQSWQLITLPIIKLYRGWLNYAMAITRLKYRILRGIKFRELIFSRVPGILSTKYHIFLEYILVGSVRRLTLWFVLRIYRKQGWTTTSISFNMLKLYLIFKFTLAALPIFSRRARPPV